MSDRDGEVEDVDLLVIGGGKAGKSLAMDRAKAGWRRPALPAGPRRRPDATDHGRGRQPAAGCAGQGTGAGVATTEG